MAGPYNSKTLMMATTAYIDDSYSEIIDPLKTEVMYVVELPGDHTQHPPKPNVVVSSSVCKLLEYPVCLNAMYPIHQLHIHTDPFGMFISKTLFKCSRLDENYGFTGFSVPFNIMYCYHHFILIRFNFYGRLVHNVYKP
ncbi:hypothetical protein ZEAMMB73_Zm00001d002164 [Zea mays]|uniref:Uncharacterized protein n=1 Tax=Zea mays TaxID=4577 RepID=A0A1D6DXA0_MAIZE|nr:hypothetical protein ZEAMMB73_Zm00001d002164 [Zea mays]